MGTKTVEERFWAKVNRGFMFACWHWKAASAHGYGLFVYKGRLQGAHRVSWQIHHGGAEIPDGLFVCHSCDNKACVNPRHLFLGTTVENMRDCRVKRRHAFGSKNGRAKLTEADVATIKISIAAGVKHAAIAAEFGVSTATISQIKNGKAWKHVVV